ncbi:MAG: hypothetical protein AAF468_03000 [Pseudomonadota bacterium]
MSDKRYDGFFIGWGKKLPEGLKLFVPLISALLIGIFAGTAWSFVTTQNDPGEGAFRGRLTITGKMMALPYPHIFIPPGKRYPNGHTMLIAGPGKRGAQQQAEKFDGKLVTVRGALLQRGDLDMMQINPRSMKLVEDDMPPLDDETVSLGRWTLSGEICDGKCYVGAMRPGNGLAHKACANLCLIGGIPPVFVSKGEVEGASFFLIGDEEGNPLTPDLLKHTAVLLSADGEIERRGDLMVFKMDTSSIRVQ